MAKRKKRGLRGAHCEHEVLTVRRVYVNRQGYANRGRDYYGTGAPLFAADVLVPARKRSGEPDGCKTEGLETRAKNAREARVKILAEARRRFR